MSPEARSRPNRRKVVPGKDHHAESSHKQTAIDPDLIHDTCQTDPDLALINAAWSGLPESVRASILMLVRAASGK